MAISGEFRHRVIGTTYLTSRSRGTVLGAKLVAYTGMGLVYGVVTLLSGTLGALAGDGPNALPSGATWPLVSLVEIVVIVLWMLLGVGFGGLISNQIAAVVVLLAYTLVGETVIGLLLNALHASSATFYLPTNAASDMVIRFAIDQLVNQGQPLTTVQQDLGAVGVPVVVGQRPGVHRLHRGLRRTRLGGQPAPRYHMTPRHHRRCPHQP